MTMQILKYTHDITTFHLRAARYALNFKVKTITNLTGIAGSTILRIEAHDPYSYPGRAKLSTITRLRKLYESYGIVFYTPACIGLQPISEVLNGNIPDLIDFNTDT